MVDPKHTNTHKKSQMLFNPEHVCPAMMTDVPHPTDGELQEIEASFDGSGSELANDALFSGLNDY